MATPKPNELGMIPVVALKSFETWQQGAVFGVFPKRYETLVKDGLVEAFQAQVDTAPVAAKDKPKQ
jgi:peroxiredoxin